MNDKVYLYGKNPLLEAIFAYKKTNKRVFDTIFLTKEASLEPKIIGALQGAKIDYSLVTKSEIESLVGKDTVHQGVCASLIEKNLYEDLDEVLKNLKDKERAIIILLDELQDPHNVGAIIRSAKAFDASAILMPENNQTHINQTVIKTSSGMNFLIPIVKIGNINTVIKKLKENDFWIYGLDGNGDTTLNSVSFDVKTVVIVGSEGSGIKQKTLENCDFKLSIKINKDCESLNASNAVAVTLYEWNKQNMLK